MRLCPPLEVGLVLPFEELSLLENSTLVYIIDVGENFEGVVARYVQFYHCALSLLELDCVGLDVHVWMVAPKKLESVGAFHFLVVLYPDPRLGEVFEDGEGSLISEAHI